MSDVVTVGGGSLVVGRGDRSVALAQQFVVAFRDDFIAAQRKHRPGNRMFVVPRQILWQFLHQQDVIPTTPDDPDNDQKVRSGCLDAIRSTLRCINRVATNPAHANAIRPMFRIVNKYPKASEYHVELSEKFAPVLNTESVEKASVFISNRRQAVRRNTKRAAKYPDMPGSAESMRNGPIYEMVLDEVSNCLMNVARRMDEYCRSAQATASSS